MRWSLQVTKFLIMHFPPASCHFLSLRSKYSPQHPVLTLLQSVILPHRISYVTTSEFNPPALYKLVTFNVPSAVSSKHRFKSPTENRFEPPNSTNLLCHLSRDSSHSRGTGTLSSGMKVAGACSWTFTFICYRGQKWVELYLHASCTSSRYAVEE
jgi:hypothetical protein